MFRISLEQREYFKNKRIEFKNLIQEEMNKFDLKEISECSEDYYFEDKLMRLHTKFRIIYMQISLIQIIVFLKVIYSYDNSNLDFKKFCTNIIDNVTQKNLREYVIEFFEKHNAIFLQEGE